MQRQETLRSSSSRRENTPENHRGKTIGCVSGLFQFISKYQKRRKLLTFGRKQNKNIDSSPTDGRHSPPQSCSAWRKQNKNLISSPTKGQKNLSETPASPSLRVDNSRNPDNTNCDDTCRKFSSDVPRSPTIPAEIRRSRPESPKNFRLPQAVESAMEKRSELLRMLQKCDEDLKTLKKIIEAVRSSDDKDRIRCGNDWKKNGKSFLEETNERPSPVSVLDEFTCPAVSSHYQRQRHGRAHQQRKKPGEEEISNTFFLSKITNDMLEMRTENPTSPVWNSKAMIQSVDEVCRDVAWGERREVGRIGLVIQDHIYGDLIEEIVGEMGCCCYVFSLPLEACKRRLSF